MLQGVEDRRAEYRAVAVIQFGNKIFKTLVFEVTNI